MIRNLGLFLFAKSTSKSKEHYWPCFELETKNGRGTKIPSKSF